MSDIIIAGFPITSNVTLRKCGHYKNIFYEIINHSRGADGHRGANGTYCYYVTISEKMLPADLFAEFWLEPTMSTRSDGWQEPAYGYTNAHFASIHWHGGVTFYEKEGGLDGAPRFVKIGCDFGHYWDEGQDYDLNYVEGEAHNTIKQLLAMYPFYSCCPYSGKWQPASAMVEHNGKLYSVSGLSKMLESKARQS